MSGILEIAVLNAASASVLAVLAWTASRVVRRPSVVHAMWALVLIKLIMPPIVEVAALPRMTGAADWIDRIGTQTVARDSVHASAGPDGATAVAVGASMTGEEVVHRPASGRFPVSGAILVVSLIGSAWLIGLTIFRSCRFGRLVARAEPAPAWLAARAAAIASRAGVRPPPIAIVAARVPPLLWGLPGRLVLLLPASLLDQLGRDELDALLVHEFAHLRRRDPWLRYLEIASIGLFWWLPVAWWARTRLRAAEEESCDAFVVGVPGLRPRTYAEALLKTVEFISAEPGGLPALATGAAETGRLKERLTMIMNRSASKKLSAIQKCLLAVLGIAALVLFPTGSSGTAGAAETVESPAAEERAAEAERAIAEAAAETAELRAEIEHLAEQIRTEDFERMHAEAERLAEEMDTEQIERLHEEALRLAEEIDTEQIERLHEEALRLAGEIDTEQIERLHEEALRLAEEIDTEQIERLHEEALRLAGEIDTEQIERLHEEALRQHAANRDAYVAARDGARMDAQQRRVDDRTRELQERMEQLGEQLERLERLFDERTDERTDRAP